jgi:hypothetical protein
MPVSCAGKRSAKIYFSSSVNMLPTNAETSAIATVTAKIRGTLGSATMVAISGMAGMVIMGRAQPNRALVL